MRSSFALALLGLALSSTACAGGASKPAATTVTAATPRTFDEGLREVGLTKIELVGKPAEGYATPGPPRLEGRSVVVSYSEGWNASRPVFARGKDGRVYLVLARPNTIVDRHVRGGCRTFLGGRMWFASAAYELPPGTTWGGSHVVSWEEHTEMVDHADTLPDGKPCPPPAID